MTILKGPFASSHFSLKRANSLLDAFDKLRYDYLSSAAPIQVEEIDPNTGEKIIKAKVTKPIPDELSGLAHDAINNLRAALDQAIYPFNAGKDAAFPFGADAKSFENNLKGRAKKMPPEIVELLRNLQPYRGGNDVLYALNKLDNTRKHAIICPMVMTVPSTTVSGSVSGPFKLPPPRWNREKNEMELCRLGKGSRISMRFDFRGYIVMTGLDLVDGAPASGMLREFARHATWAVEAIEAEATRLNLLPS